MQSPELMVGMQALPFLTRTHTLLLAWLVHGDCPLRGPHPIVLSLLRGVLHVPACMQGTGIRQGVVDYVRAAMTVMRLCAPESA